MVGCGCAGMGRSELSAACNFDCSWKCDHPWLDPLILKGASTHRFKSYPQKDEDPRMINNMDDEMGNPSQLRPSDSTGPSQEELWIFVNTNVNIILTLLCRLGRFAWGHAFWGPILFFHSFFCCPLVKMKIFAKNPRVLPWICSQFFFGCYPLLNCVTLRSEINPVP